MVRHLKSRRNKYWHLHRCCPRRKWPAFRHPQRKQRRLSQHQPQPLKQRPHRMLQQHLQQVQQPLRWATRALRGGESSDLIQPLRSSRSLLTLSHRRRVLIISIGRHDHCKGAYLRTDSSIMETMAEKTTLPKGLCYTRIMLGTLS